jgi:Oxidoreductase molybdopterin binding domain
MKAFTPRDRLRRGPFREGAFTSPLHSPRVASLLGIALGVTFIVCFLTGLISHEIQHPASWFTWPSRPAGLYRITQGVHVVTGIASIPLLLAKLWTVYPRFWAWPPFENWLHLLERITLFPLVAGSIFLLFSGVANIGGWYPWQFFFPAGHFWAAWITIGALIVHIGAKATLVRRSLSPRDEPISEPTGGLTRRGFLTVIAGTTGLLTLVTIGETLRPLGRLALLAPRRPYVGPQGFPVNKSAQSAGVINSAGRPGYRVVVDGRVKKPLSFTVDELRSMPQRDATLPIACVDGWSASLTWTGVQVRELLRQAGARPGATITVQSAQEGGIYSSSVLNPSHSQDPDTLLALRVNGEELHIDHGYPVRLIAPNAPGVMQTKWVQRLSVS